MSHADCLVEPIASSGGVMTECGRGLMGGELIEGLKAFAAEGCVRARRIADFFLPPLCLSCGMGMAGHGVLCGPCWSGIEFIERPFCPVTGVPFAFDPGDGIVSTAALAAPPPYDKARAVMRYGDTSRKMVQRFKYSDRMETAPAFARWMARAGADILCDADVIAPVPLHRNRLFSRRFNQSAELARHVAKITGIDYSATLLERVRATPPQVGLSGTARRRNVAGAFRVGKAARENLAGRIVVIVDDVVTTGATVNACALAVKAAGAAEVRVLSLARVVPGDGISI